MSLSATVRHSGNVTIIDLAGRMTLRDGAGTVRDAVKNALADGRQNILLNLAEVTYIDSSGLGEMSSAYISVSRLGGRLKLLNPQPQIQNLLHVTRLDTIFATFAEESAAVESFH